MTKKNEFGQFSQRAFAKFPEVQLQNRANQHTGNLPDFNE